MDSQYGTQQSNRDNSSNSNLDIILSWVSIALGGLSRVVWLTELKVFFAFAGIICGIIALKKVKKEGGSIILPICGILISSLMLFSAGLYFLRSEIINNYDNFSQQFDSIYHNMRDSMETWNSKIHYSDTIQTELPTNYIDSI